MGKQIVSTDNVLYETGGFNVKADGKVYRRGKIVYPHGDVYEGEFVNNERNGRGTYTFANGDKYIGDFRKGLRSGFGIFVHTCETNPIEEKRYEGTWKDGKMDGRGMLILGNGDSYDGEFSKNQIEGSGLYVYVNGDRYTGQWLRGKWHGKGKLQKVCGDIYEGDFINGKFEGYGIYKYARDAGSYSGEYKRGLPHGKGLRIYSSGNRYDGNFKNGKMEGYGIFSSYNGDVYVGCMKDNKYHDHGVLTFSHGDRYEGQFFEGVFYGKGKYQYADGGYYEGEFLSITVCKKNGMKFPSPDGKRNGRGIRVWANGNRYEGAWVNNHMEGLGNLEYFNGDVYNGFFENSLRHGQGTMIYGKASGEPYEGPLPLPTGHGKILRVKENRHCKYTGDWRYDKWHGNGQYHCSDGTSYVGEFMYGLRHGQGEAVLIPTEHILAKDGTLYRAEKYTGVWLENYMHGVGKLVYYYRDSKGKRSIIGEFQKGVLVNILKQLVEH